MTSRAPISAVLIVLAVFAGLTGVRLAYTLAYLMVLVMVASFLWSRSLAKKLRVERQSPSGTFSVGDQFEEQFVVRNRSHLPMPYCEVLDRSELRAYRPDRVCGLGAGDAVAWRARGEFERRGRHRFGPLVAHVGDPFGLFPRNVRVAPAAEVVVFPTIHHLNDSVASWAGGSFDATSTGQPHDRPPDASGVRLYQPGDPLNRVHWLSSARTGNLMSRTFDTRQSSDQLILLDLEYGIHAGTAPESTLEYAISICASVVHAALRTGKAVGLVTNDRAGTVIEARRGEAQRLRILEFLALAQADGYMPIAHLVEQHGRMWKGRGGITVITASRETSWVESVVDVGSRGQRHLAVVVDPTSFGAAGTPVRVPTSWRLAANWWVVHRGDALSTSSLRAAGM
jgi:uncharacterized protein (DUF58 family)